MERGALAIELSSFRICVHTPINPGNAQVKHIHVAIINAIPKAGIAAFAEGANSASSETVIVELKFGPSKRGQLLESQLPFITESPEIGRVDEMHSASKTAGATPFVRSKNAQRLMTLISHWLANAMAAQTIAPLRKSLRIANRTDLPTSPSRSSDHHQPGRRLANGLKKEEMNVGRVSMYSHTCRRKPSGAFCKPHSGQRGPSPSPCKS